MTFHNGQRLTAETAIASLDRARDPHMAASWNRWLHESYLGNGEFQALDEKTLRFVLRDPMADLLDLLVEIPIVAPAALDHLPEAHVGTGPYRLVENSRRCRDNGIVRPSTGEGAPPSTGYAGGPSRKRRDASRRCWTDGQTW